MEKIREVSLYYCKGRTYEIIGILENKHNMYTLEEVYNYIENMFSKITKKTKVIKRVKDDEGRITKVIGYLDGRKRLELNIYIY